MLSLGMQTVTFRLHTASFLQAMRKTGSADWLFNIDTVDKWYEYEHDPKTVVEKEEITILYDMSIQTDREITANQPDNFFKNKRDKKCILTDVAIPSDKKYLQQSIRKTVQLQRLGNRNRLNVEDENLSSNSSIISRCAWSYKERH